MMSAQAPLRKVLDSVNIRTPKCIVYSGTSCAPFTSPDIIKSLLEHQLVEPINWLKTIQNIFKENGSGSTIYEVGPGKQLRSMISRINKSLMNDFRNLGTWHEILQELVLIKETMELWIGCIWYEEFGDNFICWSVWHQEVWMKEPVYISLNGTQLNNANLRKKKRTVSAS